MMDKQELRAEMRRRKAAVDSTVLRRMSEHVAAVLTRHPRWLTAQTVLLYHSLPDEVNTHALIALAVSQGKQVVLPAVVGNDIELRIYHGDSGLRESSMHIMEPQGEPFTATADIDMAVIPGVAFTMQGARLGRGRGYYDRLLPRLAHTFKTGLCWPFQIVEDIPTEPHDICMDEVVTVPCKQA